MDEEIKERILEVITNEWQATLPISELAEPKVHWYRALSILKDLEHEGKVELLSIKKSKYWKLK